MTPGFLRASTDDWAALSAARAAIVLVGSYDGSGNFGDLLQTREAIRRVLAARFEGLAVAVVVEAEYAAGSMWSDGLLGDVVVLEYSDVAPEEHVVGFLPCSTMVYLTGGGYINGYWGNRHLQHLSTVVQLVGGDGRPISRIIASGLQVSRYDELWRWTPWFVQCRPLMVRDPDSAGLLVELDPAIEASDLGDDALDALLEFAIDPAPRCVNVHINTESYSAADRDERVAWFADALSHISAAHGALVCRSLIAFDDDRIDEWVVADELVAAWSSAGAGVGRSSIEFDRVSLPRLVRDGGRLELGSLGTLTCSYHVGLLSLVSGVPTLLLADNDYYEQKMRGLAATFGLGDEAVVCRGDGPDVVTRLERVSAQLAASQSLARRALIAQASAARWAVAQAIALFERDAMRESLDAFLPTYRSAVKESADMHRRVAVVSEWLEEQRLQNDARTRRLADTIASLRRAGPR